MSKISKRFKKFKLNVKEFLYRFKKNENTIIEEHNGKNETSDKICFFASYDPDGLIDDYVIEYLKALQENNYDIYFCTTSSQKIRETDLIRMKQICVKIFRRENVGLDFCSWKLCYSKINPSKNYSQIVLTNDSILGPIFNLKPTFDAINHSYADFIGLTENYEYSHHLQSYFLIFKENTIKNFLPKFMENIKILFDKDKIIHSYEIGLSTELMAKNFKIEALYPYNNIIKNIINDSNNDFAKKQVNPTTILWDTLIVNFNYPFIKRELLTKNTVSLKSIDNWFDIISKHNPDLAKTIVNYIKRTSKKNNLNCYL